MSEARAGAACAVFVKILLILSSPEEVTGYNVPVHVHILCIRYATIGNTAVLCMRVRIVCLPRVRGAGAPGMPKCYYNSLLCRYAFLPSGMVLRAFSVLCYSKFEHDPHTLGYFCAKFRFFRDLHC